MKLRFLIIGILLFLSIYSCGSKKKRLREKYGIEEKDTDSKHKPTLAEIFAETISAGALDYHVYNLASDSMEGRETGKPGANKAARYIWDFFADQRMQFPKKLDGYLQKYIASQNEKPKVLLKTDRKTYKLGEDFISFFPHDSINIFDDKIIFVGYGIEDPKYNDYAYQDVKGKVVLVVGGEPRDKYGNYIISNEVEPYTGKIKPSVWSQDPIKAYILRRNAAMKYGAKAMLYYDPQNMDYFWRNFRKHFEKKQMEITVSKDSVYDFFINKDIFTDITGYDRPDEIKYTKRTRKYKVPITINYYINSDNIIEGSNAIGIIEGDPKNDEYIIVLSHYDGQGKRHGEIYNSANNNASGVAASFEIAEAFNIAKDSGFIPKRNIVFINTSGFEQDMIGARFFIEHPIIPLEKIVAVIEMVKLGRIKGLKSEDEIPEFYPINLAFKGFEKNNFKSNIKSLLSYNHHIKVRYSKFKENSEYVYFLQKKIPVIYYYGTNDYADYKKPTDTPEIVSYDIIEKRAKFLFQIIWQLAYQKKL